MPADFDAFWYVLTEANPGLKDPDSTMRLTVGQFKRQLERAYQTGNAAPKPRTPKKPFDLNSLFGG